MEITKRSENQNHITGKVLMDSLKTKFPLVSELNNFIDVDISTQERELQFAEDRLTKCKKCKTGEQCLNYCMIDLAGNPVPENRAGQYPVNINHDGKIQYTGCVKWQNLQRIERIEAVGVPPIFTNCTFNNFKLRNENARKAQEGCRDFVRRVIGGEKNRGLLLSGPFGTGKTHLAAATLIELSEAGIQKLKFVSVPKFLAAIKKSYEDHGEQDHLENAMQANILALDDIGNERMTDWAREQIYLLINDRYENRKLTIITSNANLKDMENRIGGAALSRIREMCTGYILDGPDYRK